MNYLLLNNKYYIFDQLNSDWRQLDEYGCQNGNLCSPTNASYRLAKNEAVLLSADTVKFKVKDYWPKAWIWSEKSFFYQKDEKAPLIFMNYDSDYNPDEIYPVLPKWSPILEPSDNKPCDYNKFGISGYKQDKILIKQENMSKFLDCLKKGNLKDWIHSSGKIVQ